jgi:hypothetical protein
MMADKNAMLNGNDFIKSPQAYELTKPDNNNLYGRRNY